MGRVGGNELVLFLLKNPCEHCIFFWDIPKLQFKCLDNQKHFQANYKVFLSKDSVPQNTR